MSEKQRDREVECLANCNEMLDEEKTWLHKIWEKTKLPKIFNLVKPTLLYSFNEIPEIVLALSVFFTASDGIVKKIENDNLLFWTRDYIDRKIDDKVDEKNEEQCLVIKNAVLKSLRCSKESQIKRINDILCAAINGDITYAQSEDYINVISELSENEAICLGCLYRHFQSSVDNNSITGYDNDFMDCIDETDREYLINRLIGKGLLKESSHDQWQNMETNFVPSEFVFYPTEFGKKLFKNLNEYRNS